MLDDAKKERKVPSVTGLGHLGVYVKDLDGMTKFYSEFLGFEVTDRSDELGLVFLSARPQEEHHEVLLARDPVKVTGAQQISFPVESLSDLREFYRQIVELDLEIDHIFNHGNAFGCYFYDPEHNQIEVYWQTGIDWPQPFGEHLDLSLPEAELLQLVDEMKNDPRAKN